MTIDVGIYIYDEVEVLDFTGPFEVFTTAARVHGRLVPAADKLFNVFTVADSMNHIFARGGLQIKPTFNISNHPEINLLIVPGGIVTAELAKKDVINWIIASSEVGDITASVCTGAFLLAEAGLLNSKAATTHWEDIEEFHTLFPDVKIRHNVRWVDEGAIVTAAGISAGIDMSLHLISRIANSELAVCTAKQMEFEWTKNP